MIDAAFFLGGRDETCDDPRSFKPSHHLITRQTMASKGKPIISKRVFDSFSQSPT
jgi:hypothetical protein